MTEINILTKEQELLEKNNLLELELEKKSTESKNNWELFLRCKADIENIKKRTDKELLNISSFALQNVMTDFIPLLDSFELCIKNKNETDLIKADGVFLIYKLIISILEKHNLKRIIICENEKIDISKHEVVSIEYEDASDDDDIIKSVLQNGYMLNDRVLRYAKVSIIKKNNS